MSAIEIEQISQQNKKAVDPRQVFEKNSRETKEKSTDVVVRLAALLVVVSAILLEVSGHAKIEGFTANSFILTDSTTNFGVFTTQKKTRK